MKSAEFAQSREPTGRSEGGADRLDEIIYHISHDVRACSRALLVLPDWIAEDMAKAGQELPPGVDDAICMMRKQASRLDGILRDLLEFSRIGRFQSPAYVDWADVTQSVTNAGLLPQGFALTCDFQAKGAVLGRSDAERLVEALLSNAVKHHDKGQGQITIATRTEGALCHLTVCDDGPGIPTDLRAKALKLLATLRPRDEIEGSGVGLATVCKIAETYGGSVSWPELPTPRGLAICVSLPADGAGG